MPEPKGVKQRYKTTNWGEYNAALKARGSLTIWLHMRYGTTSFGAMMRTA